MKKLLVLFVGTLGFTASVKAQTGISAAGTAPDASAMLDVIATDKGFLAPRVALAATNNSTTPVNAPANGLMVYNTATAGSAPNNVTPGYYYWDSSVSLWQKVSAGNALGFIQNQNSANQTANWRITGTGQWGGATSKGSLSIDQGSSIELGGTGSPYIDFANATADDFDARIQLTGDDYLSISGANVGIGNTAPAHQLSVGAATVDGQAVTIRGYSNTPGSWKGGGAFGFSSAAVIMGELSGVAQLGGHNGTLGAWANLAINSGGGNVGVGISAPLGKLDVQGPTVRTGTHATSPSFYVTGTLNSGQTGPAAGNVEFRHDNATQGIGFGYNTIYQTGSNTNNELNLLSRGTSHITLNAYAYSTGNVGVGLTGPTEKLEVNGAIKMPGASATDNNSPALTLVSDDDFLYDAEYINHYAMGFHNFNDGAGLGANSYMSGYYGVDLFTGGAPRFRINNNGTVKVNNLAGTGTRFVVADASGNLSATSSTSSGVVTGSGTLNTIPKWTPNGSTLGNSLITDDATTITAAGQFDVTGGTGTSYTTAPIEIRTSAIAPRLAFHYSGVVASQIAVENSGTIAIRDNPGTGYENFAARDVSVTRDLYVSGKQYMYTSSGQASAAHGISWYQPSFVTWYDYMAPAGGTNAPSGAAAQTDAVIGVSSWARRFNIEDVAGYGWLFESGANTAGTAPTVKFAINSNNGNVHSTGSVYAGASAILGTNIAAGYYQDANNGAYRGLNVGGDVGYYFQNYNGANTRMYIGLSGTYAGNVGIGNTTPAAALHLQGDRYSLFGPNSTWGAYLTVGGNGSVNTYASVAATNGNLHIDAATGAYAMYLNYYKGTGGIQFGNGASGTIGYINNTGSISMNTGYQISGTAASGNYLRGNGTNFVSSPLVAGDISALGFIPNNGSGDWQIASNSNATGYSQSTLELRETNFAGAGQQPPRLGFHWGGVVASQIAIESDGKISILNNPGTGYENIIANRYFASTTSNSYERTSVANGIWGSESLNNTSVHIYNSESEQGGFFANGDYNGIYSPGDNDLVKFMDEDFFNNSGTIYDASAVRARIDGSGSYFAISDRNSKENIVQVTNAVNKIKQINGYTYDFIRNDVELAKNSPLISSAGVIAQELETVLPQAVSNTDGQYMVNYSAMSALFIEAIKEQQLQIEELKTLNSKMQERIEVLELKK